MTPKDLLVLRETCELHPKTEARLKELLTKVQLDSYALPEGWGIAGSGRADLIVYLHNRYVIHVEIFAHSSTVFRDLHNLHMSRADVKVALIIDQPADTKVADAYFRAVSDNRYYWFWLSQVLDPAYETDAIKFIEELLREAVLLGGPLMGQRPTATVHPANGAPFSRVTFCVTGFHPDCNFTVFWDPDGQTTVVGGGREIGADGTADCTVWIPHGGLATPGKHMLRAVDSLGNVVVTSFEVSTAWLPPYMRAIPPALKPGEILTFVGAGAPRSCKLTVWFWQGNTGNGVATIDADERGDFEGSFEIPWLHQGVNLVTPGRHRISVSPAEGSFPFEAHTFIEIPEFTPPRTIEWVSGQSTQQEGISILRPNFRIDGDRIQILLRIRNDRTTEIYFAPRGSATILELAGDLKQKAYDFECLSVEDKKILPNEEIQTRIEFRRKFDSLPLDFRIPARTLIIGLSFLTREVGVVNLRIHEVWPAEIWCS